MKLNFFKKKTGASDRKPDEVMHEADGYKKGKHPNKKPWSLKKKVLFSAICVLSAVILAAVIFALIILIDPLGGLDTIAEQTHTPASTSAAAYPSQGETPAASATPDPYDVLREQADFSMLKDVVNILLIGVDHGDTARWDDLFDKVI